MNSQLLMPTEPHCVRRWNETTDEKQKYQCIAHCKLLSIDWVAIHDMTIFYEWHWIQNTKDHSELFTVHMATYQHTLTTCNVHSLWCYYLFCISVIFYVLMKYKRQMDFYLDFNFIILNNCHIRFYSKTNNNQI